MCWCFFRVESTSCHPLQIGVLPCWHEATVLVTLKHKLATLKITLLSFDKFPVPLGIADAPL